MSMQPPVKPDSERDARAGFLFALSAFTLWGLMPLLWKALDNVDPLEVTAHRAFWSLPVGGLVLLALGRTGDILPTLRSPRKLSILFTCSVLISVNWGVFIWAIGEGRTIESAFAYYINPLLNVALGAVFLGERFNRMQLLSIALASLAVIVLAVASGGLPWISLVLAGTFAIYGLLRKTVDVGPAQGFLIEILLISAFAGGFILWLGFRGEAAFLNDGSSTLLLMMAGPGTAFPLILYAAGAKRLAYSTIGLMQYIAPSMIFLLGVFAFGEPFGPGQLFAFLLIWTALVLYSWSLFRSKSKT